MSRNASRDSKGLSRARPQREQVVLSQDQQLPSLGALFETHKGSPNTDFRLIFWDLIWDLIFVCLEIAAADRGAETQRQAGGRWLI